MADVSLGMSNLLIQGIIPDLKVKGNTQQLTYDFDNTAKLSLYNKWVPTPTVSAQTALPFLSSTLSGIGLFHQTNNTDTIGKLSVKKIVGNVFTDDIVSFNNDGSATFTLAPFSSTAPTVGNHLVNKTYADSLMGSALITLTGAVSGTGTGTVPTVLSSDITAQSALQNFNFSYGTSTVGINLNNTVTSVVASTKTILNFNNGYSSPGFDVGIKLRHSTPPSSTPYHRVGALYIEATDTLGTIQEFAHFDVSATGPQLSIKAKTFFTGDVDISSTSVMTYQSGSATTFAGTINVPTPTVTTHATTKGYVDSTVAAKPITLTGAVTGTSTTGTIATTLTAITTSQISNYTAATNALIVATSLSSLAAPTTALNFNAQRATNAADPVNNQDLVTKLFMESRALDASKLTGYPGNNKTFLRGDTSWTNTLGSSSGLLNIILNNTDTSASSEWTIQESSFTRASYGYNHATSEAYISSTNRIKVMVGGTERAAFETNGNTVLTGTLFSLRPYATMYFTNNGTNTGVTANVFTKMLGTTISAGANLFNMTNNRATFAGTVSGTPTSIIVRIEVTVSCSHNQIIGGATMGTALYKNGVAVAGSANYTYAGGNGQLGSMSFSTITTLNINDYVETYLTCSSSLTLSPTHYAMTITPI